MAVANVDVELRWLDGSPLEIGETAHVGVFAVSDMSEPQGFAAAEIIIAWDHATLELTAVDPTGAIPLLSADFPFGNAFGLNEASPPADGDGLFVVQASLGSPAEATSSGSLLGTLLFEVLVGGTETVVDVLPSAGSPTAFTVVFHPEIPGLPVTGEITGASIMLAGAENCLGDLDSDGDVDFQDLLELLAAWGICEECTADLNFDRSVGFQDLLLLLAVWGDCAERS